ncbi:MAG TPA: M48 family metalloprotease [Streptosporangiaceae bacterium]
MKCPDCSAAVEVDAGFTGWCEDCGWNLVPPNGAKPLTRRQRRRTAVAARHEDAVLARAMRGRGQQVRHDLQSRVAVGIAVAVQLLTLGTVALAGWLGWEARRYPPLALPALACLALAYALRPRLGRLPREFVLSRAACPSFFGLLDQISKAAGAPAFDHAVLATGPTAATARVGIRRQRVLIIGAALWSVLDWDERMAVLAHEAGHNVSNDSRRGYLLGTSLKALEVWVAILTPRTRAFLFQQILFRMLVRSPLRWVTIGLYAALLRLSSGVSRLAEYRADDIAATVAGTDATARALDKMLVTRDGIARIAQTVLWQPGVSLWTAQREFVDSFPQRQRDRLRRIDQRSATGLYSTHPSVTRRIAYLCASPVPGSITPLSAGQLAQIDDELEPQLHKLARDIRARLESSLTPAQLETLPKR